MLRVRPPLHTCLPSYCKQRYVATMLRSTLCVALLAGSRALAPRRPVALGLVKYAHNACCCVVDAATGALLFAGEKERLTRVKNDGGCVGDLVRHALQACDATMEDVVSVVANDHHRSVEATEAALLRARALGLTSAILDPSEVADPANLWPHQREMSHHRAHALGAVATFGPAECGLVVCMDGMGDCARRFRGADAAHIRDDLDKCVHVLNDEIVAFADVPDSARECETVYREDNGKLTPLFKRWCRGQTEELLNEYNDWFCSPLDSLGAGYSHAAHRIFGDWNACGKVMGLAPWGGTLHYDAGWGGASHKSWAPLAARAQAAMQGRPRIYRGAVWPDEDAGLTVDRAAMQGVLDMAAGALDAELSFPPRDLWATKDDAARACGAVLAHAVQEDLEDVALAFLRKARDMVPECSRVVLCGGVGLNSVLNGKIEHVFKDIPVLVPPAPGDEGCALGCAVAGLREVPDLSQMLPRAGAVPEAPDDALLAFGQWLDVEYIDDEALIATCASMIAAERSIVFWFEGKSEFGPRALGHRSIVAPATNAESVDVINRVVKGREDFRPLAPAVLAEEAVNWFEGPCRSSPYMSRVWTLTEEAALKVPACAHVDRTARPQTVSSDETDIARYYRLIRGVFLLTRVPVVLNTSFNTKPSEPVVETTQGAVSSFLAAVGRLDDAAWDLVLAFPGVLARPRACPVDATGRFGDAETSFPKRRHENFAVTDTWGVDGSSTTLQVEDLDEPLEDAPRTGRGAYVFLDDLEARVYGLCDGELSAAEIAAEVLGDLDISESEDVTAADVYLRLARLWRRTLVQLML